jgi:hypothetical protein
VLIQKTRILNESIYLVEVPHNGRFRLLSFPTDLQLTRAGFVEGAAPGARILPAAVGKTSRHNADGTWRTRRDLPKEPRYLGSRSWKRKEWHGNEQVEVEEIVDIYRPCFPRELDPPPSVEVTLIDHNDRRAVVIDALTKTEESSAESRHAINLMLELFGPTSVVTDNLQGYEPPAINRVNWVLLPPGEHPFERITEHVGRMIRGKPSIEKVAVDRQHTIYQHRPDRVFRGEGGFNDYLAYLFEDVNLVVLESIYKGNAIYIIADNWEGVSALSKAEIIRGDLHAARIVHNEGWKGRLAQALAGHQK